MKSTTSERFLANTSEYTTVAICHGNVSPVWMMVTPTPEDSSTRDEGLGARRSPAGTPASSRPNSTLACAAPGRTNDRDQLRGFHRERDAGERADSPPELVAVALGDVVDADSHEAGARKRKRWILPVAVLG